MSIIFYQSIIIFVLIIFLTFLQKYHFIMLDYLSKVYWWIFRILIRFLIRTSIIIHELSHLFFWILSWAKIHKVELFRSDWWRVSFWTKNYIWHLSEYSWSPWYLTILFFNQIWIFLTSIWPLIIWITSIFFLIFYFNIPFDIKNLNNLYLFLNESYLNYFYLICIIIFIPWFILSFQDIKNFIISKQDTFWATFVGSFINTIIFIIFLLFLSFFYNYFLLFSFVYFITFFLLFCVTIFTYVISKIFR